jgi:alpha-glucosidase (family GH31 glycosyl hydrolase)
VREGATKRGVYFPAGDDWVDWWTGRAYEGGKDAEIDAPLDRLPLFARAGAVLPTQAVVQHTGEMSKATLSLLVVPGADGTSSFYEDAGDGYGARRTTTAVLRRGSLKLTRAGAYAGRRLGALEFLPGRMPGDVRDGFGGTFLPFAHKLDGHTFVSLPPSVEVTEFTLVP